LLRKGKAEGGREKREQAGGRGKKFGEVGGRMMDTAVAQRRCTGVEMIWSGKTEQEARKNDSCKTILFNSRTKSRKDLGNRS